MDKKIKLLYIAHMDSIHSRRWIKYFADGNYTVDVLYFDNTEETELANIMANVKFHRIKIKQYNNMPNILKYVFFRINMITKVNKIKAIIRDINPDIIHVHFIDFWAYLASNLNFPLVMTAWGSDILVFPKQFFLYRYILQKSLDRATIITCDAEHMKGAIQKYGVTADKIKVIYFGTDLNQFNPSKKDSNIRKELGFEDDAKLIISLRSLKPVYDIPTFIRAVPLVLEKIKEARFVVVGDGPEKDNLIRLSQDLGISDKVRFAGRLSDDDLQRYTASADIYVSTSLSDGGLAASTAEAMACEIPVVITDFGNNSEWVENNKSGLLFKLQDFKGLADGIIYLLNNPEKAAEMARNGRGIIDERNNWHKEMEKVEQMYQELASGRV